MNKQKVVISYFHGNEKKFADKLIKWNETGELFESVSTNELDISSELKDKEIKNLLRSEYIKDATVLILLCGPNTKKSMLIDWELQAAMYSDKQNKKLGIVVVNLPESKNKICKASVHEGKIIKSQNKPWPTTRTRQEAEYYYPELPDRIIDNLLQDHVYLTIVNWNMAYNNKDVLMDVIDGAHKRRLSQNYYVHKTLKRNND